MVKHPNASREAITSSPQFSRMEKFAGLEAYILKDSGPAAETETAYSVETGKIPLRIVSKLKDKTQLIHMIEAVGIEFRDISEGEFQLPNLPIRFDVAQERVQSFKQAGQNELAGALEQAINKLKASN